MKVYSAEFKVDTVVLYRSRPGATIAQIARNSALTAKPCVTGSARTTGRSLRVVGHLRCPELAQP